MHDPQMIHRRTVLRGFALAAGAVALAPVLDASAAWAGQAAASEAPLGTLTALTRGSTGLIGVSQAARGGHDLVTMTDDGRTTVVRMSGVPASAVVADVAVTGDGSVYAAGHVLSERDRGIVQDDDGRSVRMTTLHPRAAVWSRRSGETSWRTEYESPAGRFERLLSIATSDAGRALAVGAEVDEEDALLGSLTVDLGGVGSVRRAVPVPTAQEASLAAVSWWGGAWAGASAAVTGSALWTSVDGSRWVEVGQPEGWDDLAVRAMVTTGDQLVAAGNSLTSGSPLLSTIPAGGGRATQLPRSSGREAVESLAGGRGGTALLLRQGGTTTIEGGARHGSD